MVSTNHWEVPKQTARVARTSLTEGNAPLELVGETLGAALNEIATLTPDRLKQSLVRDGEVGSGRVKRIVTAVSLPLHKTFSNSSNFNALDTQ
jgi:hypothetical protein